MDTKVKVLENPLDNVAVDGGFTAIFRTLGCIGDSLSSGEHESFENGVKGYHDYYNYSWGQFIARKCGLKAYNWSVGGLTAKDFHSLSYHNRVFTVENACQAYIIALGVNDVSQVIKNICEFGSLGDVDFDNCENNKDTVIGNYVKIIQRIREVQPKARVFVTTMPKENGMDNARREYYEKFAEILRKLPDLFEFLYVIDFDKYAPVYDDDFKRSYYLGGHLNAMGYKLTADMYMNYIDYIIKTNPEDFSQVAFIGKSVHNSAAKW